MSPPTAIPEPLHPVGWVRREIFKNQVSDDVIWGWARRRLIPCVYIGRRVFFPERRLGEFIARGGLVGVATDEADEARP